MRIFSLKHAEETARIQAGNVCRLPAAALGYDECLGIKMQAGGSCRLPAAASADAGAL